MNSIMKCKMVLVAISMAISFGVYAECQSHFETWATGLQSKGNLDLENSVCKVWPANPALTIAALPLPHKNNDADAGVYDLAVIVADSLTGAVISQIHQPSAIIYDAVRLRGITIDTARYQLTNSNRAFGVRVNYSGSSSIFPFSTTSLNLYVVGNKSLHPVLERLIVEERNGDWDGSCKGTFDATSRSIDIGTLGSEGYATLKIMERKTTSVSEILNAECVTKLQSDIRINYLLPYKGGRYLVPKKMAQGF